MYEIIIHAKDAQTSFSRYFLVKAFRVSTTVVIFELTWGWPENGMIIWRNICSCAIGALFLVDAEVLGEMHILYGYCWIERPPRHKLLPLKIHICASKTIRLQKDTYEN